MPDIEENKSGIKQIEDSVCREAFAAYLEVRERIFKYVLGPNQYFYFSRFYEFTNLNNILNFDAVTYSILTTILLSKRLHTDELFMYSGSEEKTSDARNEPAAPHSV